MKTLIVGGGGFIGAHLLEEILRNHRNWQVTVIDINSEKISHLLLDKNVKFFEIDIVRNSIEDHVSDCDVMLPLAAIASPAVYVTDPLRVFELDFEANLKIIKWAVKYQKRVIFPSTSEVYGMCADEEFLEDESNCVTGPVSKQRWIYSCSKQMLDRVIYAHGLKNNLDYTLFRPFNWIGPKLDDISNPESGSSRVVTQFLSNIIHGKDIKLVDGGNQIRSFTDIADAIAALIKIILNENNCATRQIFNIGNPHNQTSIKNLAQEIVELAKKYDQLKSLAEKTKIIEIDPNEYYGKGYQDVSCRIPSIKKAETVLQWTPTVSLRESLRKIMDDLFKKNASSR
ncbi:MAG: bifunctional UDP-4-keto-pentose/UDP-xylose synthase [Holosporaceae bacterium]|jgi:nucleoside-diphosphate-sugar epimerase|nr:bifunctional UDP-4-keto-pentose/UDP-xylose synthase [Holosporaceae bacterium]